VSKARDNTKEPLAGLYFAEVTIPNKKGLHARASAQFVRCASNFTAQVRVTREGHTVGGTSIMGILMLSAGIGSSIRVTAKGREAAAALDAIARLCADKFGEEE
jgi:phosphocarrier protein